MTQTLITLLTMLQVFVTLGSMGYGAAAAVRAIAGRRRRSTRRRLAMAAAGLVATPLGACAPLLLASFLSATAHGGLDEQTRLLVVMGSIQVLTVFAFVLTMSTAAATVRTAQWIAEAIDHAARTLPTFSFSIDFRPEQDPEPVEAIPHRTTGPR